MSARFDLPIRSDSLSNELGDAQPNPDGAGLMDHLLKAPAMQALLARLEAGGVCALPSACEAAHPFLAAVLHRARPNRPVLLVTDGLRTQEAALQDLQTWLAIDPESAPRRLLFYPDWEVLPHESKLPHVDVVSDRLATLVGLIRDASAPPAPLVVASITALLQRTFAPACLHLHLRRIREGETWVPLDLVEWLEDRGYEPEAQVSQKGTLSLRGGILDLWPPPSPWPVRLEFFGDEIESLRQFDPLTQLSRDRIGEVVLTPAGELAVLKKLVAGTAIESPLATLLDHLPERTLILLSEPEALRRRVEAYSGQIPPNDRFFASWESLLELAAARKDAVMEMHESPDEAMASVAGTEGLRFQSLEVFRPLGTRRPEPAVAETRRREFFDQLHRWSRSGVRVHVFCNNAGESQRFAEIWREYGLNGGANEPKASRSASHPLPVSSPGSAPSDEAPERTLELQPAARPGTEGVSADRLTLAGGLTVHIGALGRGFLHESGRLAVVTDAEVFGRYKVLRPRRLKSAQAQMSRSLLDIDFTEFEEGDYVVHVEYGVGRFLGLQKAPPTPGFRGGGAGPGQECLAIEYAPSHPEDPPPRLYVPVAEAHLVSKYVGAGKARPPLNTLGGTRWAKARKDAERAVADLAAELLEIQAARETEPGHAYPPDMAWQREFEAAFVFEETPDQQAAIDATKADMERPRPMDRLICGDVGFGKTEVAIRAAFKAVLGGRQVAVLVPTTVLAQQHFNTFSERTADYPVHVELLSRFRSRRELSHVIEQIKSGAVDIVIGTHRLLQRDVEFKDLGLVVIDEEQRFGVMHKERFKRLRRTVDVLTLSATPIPRTLYLALSGARDMSTIETPPQDRLPIETIVSAYDERLIRDAIQRELNRQGQVFFLHNRVVTIDGVAARLRALVPQARLVIGHGQMDADELEEVMTRFVNGEADVLLSTTIIESGLDIPNANTIIIDRADRFGLSELYQLRGRVGRYKHQAYAYLLLPRHARLLTEARKRIAAIRQYSSLGSGFKIAMRDLEIRGAGNLLGPQQSGHITAVGFDLYCQLLKQSISALKGEKVQPRIEVQVRLDFLALNPAEEETRRVPATPGRVPAAVASHSPGFPEGAGPGIAGSPAGLEIAGLPVNYIPDARQRIEVHRRIAQITGPGDIRRLKADLRDRFGPPPPQVERLLQVAELRLLGGRLGITAIESKDDRLMLTRNGELMQVGGRFPRLTKRDARGRLQEIRRFLLLGVGP